MADGTTGDFTTVPKLNYEGCRQHCNQETICIAFELDHGNNYCKIFENEIAKSTGHYDNTICYIRLGGKNILDKMAKFYLKWNKD